MPVYEYKCEKCGTKFEIMRGITAGEEGIRCPRCSAEKPVRVISAVCGGRVADVNRGNLRFPT